MSTGEKFWQLNTRPEFAFVDAYLRGRFPAEYSKLTRCLEEADPHECVYPDNPGEYGDVVREALVLLSAEPLSLSDMSQPALDVLIRKALARCFGSEPEEARLEVLTRLLFEN